MITNTTLNHIGGKVNSLNPTIPLKNANLYAQRGNGYVGFAITNANGVYIINSLPSGSLKIIADMIGYKSDTVSVDLEKGSLDSVNFYLVKLSVDIKTVSSKIPSKYLLFQNHPNPFNPSTTIKFQIPKLYSPHVTGWDRTVTLKIHDISGRDIAILMNEKKSPGTYEVTFDASELASGVYFYKLATEDYSEEKKMVLLK